MPFLSILCIARVARVRHTSFVRAVGGVPSRLSEAKLEDIMKKARQLKISGETLPAFVFLEAENLKERELREAENLKERELREAENLKERELERVQVAHHAFVSALKMRIGLFCKRYYYEQLLRDSRRVFGDKAARNKATNLSEWRNQDTIFALQTLWLIRPVLLQSGGTWFEACVD